jgi:hypothetical protein
MLHAARARVNVVEALMLSAYLIEQALGTIMPFYGTPQTGFIIDELAGA